MASVPVLAGGLPVKLRLLGLKVSQLGKAVPLVRVAVTVNASPSASVSVWLPLSDQGIEKDCVSLPLMSCVKSRAVHTGALFRLVTLSVKLPHNC